MSFLVNGRPVAVTCDGSKRVSYISTDFVRIHAILSEFGWCEAMASLRLDNGAFLNTNVMFSLSSAIASDVVLGSNYLAIGSAVQNVSPSLTEIEPTPATDHQVAGPAGTGPTDL